VSAGGAEHERRRAGPLARARESGGRAVTRRAARLRVRRVCTRMRERNTRFLTGAEPARREVWGHCMITGISYSGPAWRTATSPMDEKPP